MSYYVEIVRPIRRGEVEKLIESDPELELIGEGQGWIDFQFMRDTDQAVFSFAQGRISITSPSDFGWQKAEELASYFEAEVIGEEDEAPVKPAAKPGIFDGRVTWIGWPVLVVVLFIMLLVK